MGFPRFLFTLALAALTATAVSAQPATRNLTVGQTVIGHLLPDEREIISPTGELLARLSLGGRDWEEKSPHMVVALPVDGRYLMRLSSGSRDCRR